jgi:tetratricopeptide (TPR) repeat protein
LTRKYLNLLIDNKYADPLLYVYIAKTYENEDNAAKQLESIKKGRIAYPDSKIIINEEINYYIKNNDLITLKKAIEKEIAGGNAESNFYYIRGFVNDQIGSGKITPDGREITFETEKDTAILRLAEKDYLKAIELDPNSLNAIYNIATLYVNFGNYWNKKASLLPYSATKQFDDYTEIQNVNYNKAIAYYEKADGFTDLTEDERKNMYLDLRQLYAKLKKMDKVKEMNTKIQEME